MAEEEKKLQTFLPDPFRFIPAAIGEAGKDLADLGSDALELVYGKERTDKIEGALSDALNFGYRLNDNVDIVTQEGKQINPDDASQIFNVYNNALKVYINSGGGAKGKMAALDSIGTSSVKLKGFDDGSGSPISKEEEEELGLGEGKLNK